ncbi:MAG: hypothetical protein AAF701_00725 [Pseudomonadota bacterium]
MNFIPLPQSAINRLATGLNAQQHQPWGRKLGGKPVDKIYVLTHDDAIVMDTELLGDLYENLGEACADTVICRALDDLSTHMATVERCYNTSDMAGLTQAGMAVADIAQQLGMKNLHSVAQDVGHLSSIADGPALAAAIARLVRLGDRALTAVWEVQDMGGAI